MKSTKNTKTRYFIMSLNLIISLPSQFVLSVIIIGIVKFFSSIFKFLF